jgi:hypothetical protein
MARLRDNLKMLHGKIRVTPGNRPIRDTIGIATIGCNAESAGPQWNEMRLLPWKKLRRSI